MNITLIQSDLANMIFHLNVMSKSIHKGMKSNYGLLEGRRKNKLFDAVKFKLEAAFAQDQKDEYEFEFSFEEMDMLHSFVDWYVSELELDAEDQGEDIKENDMLVALTHVKNKIEKELDLILSQ